MIINKITTMKVTTIREIITKDTTKALLAEDTREIITTKEIIMTATDIKQISSKIIIMITNIKKIIKSPTIRDSKTTRGKRK